MPPGAYPTHEASGSSHPPAETTLAGTEAGFPTKLFSLRESCWYHTAPLPPHSPPPAEVTPPPHPSLAEKYFPQQTEGGGAGLGVAQFKAAQDTPKHHLTKLPKGLESRSDHLLHVRVE